MSHQSRLRDDAETEHKDEIRASRLLKGDFKDVSAAVVNRRGAGADVAEMEEHELIELASTPEGVAVMLARQRARVGG